MASASSSPSPCAVVGGAEASPFRCPACRRTLQRSYTLRGLLWAMVCFPCGMYCCMRRLRRRCSACECDVIISDGGVPTVAQTYNTFADFKWQFPPPALRIGAAVRQQQQQQQKCGKDNDVVVDEDDDDDYHDVHHDEQQTAEEEHQQLCSRRPGTNTAVANHQ